MITHLLMENATEAPFYSNLTDFFDSDETVSNYTFEPDFAEGSGASFSRAFGSYIFAILVTYFI
jgi:hypothetical protein